MTHFKTALRSVPGSPAVVRTILRVVVPPLAALFAVGSTGCNRDSEPFTWGAVGERYAENHRRLRAQQAQPKTPKAGRRAGAHGANTPLAHKKSATPPIVTPLGKPTPPPVLGTLTPALKVKLAQHTQAGKRLAARLQRRRCRRPGVFGRAGGTSAEAALRRFFAQPPVAACEGSDDRSDQRIERSIPNTHWDAPAWERPAVKRLAQLCQSLLGVVDQVGRAGAGCDPFPAVAPPTVPAKAPASRATAGFLGPVPGRLGGPAADGSSAGSGKPPGPGSASLRAPRVVLPLSPGRTSADGVTRTSARRCAPT